ncbi:MAG: hypothetical protein CML46_19355 [Rhodobacteraceae bacterium]|nr:hypothetical protein [Paracoccaceae bacterium]MBR29072.1 hypothetical protein [Paracoccaceae bacterium]|tara:strand:- start:670 stop:1149 length:480 start_codon:yes stop_codon:yes gene_type:complete
MTHDPRSVANKILDIADKSGKQLTIMQLLKLVYLANGWWLSFKNEPFTKTEAQAWQYGPVHPEVYNAFKGSGNSVIRTRATSKATGLEYRDEFAPDEVDMLKAVVDSYGDHHAFALSNIMHRPGTPWTLTVERDGLYRPIPNSLVKEHFDELRRSRSAA